MDSLGGPVATSSAIAGACDALNMAMASSLVQRQTTLVRTVKVSMPAPAEFYDNVFDFAASKYVDSLRHHYRADLSILVVNDARMCGLPLILNHVAEVNTAYCAVDWRCMLYAYGLSHMVGHLFGAGHLASDDYDTEDDATFSYGHGYSWSFLDTDCGFTTIMGYYDDQNCCWSSIGIGNVIPYFSNPNVQYSGVPTGIDSIADNARVIRTHADSVAFFNLNSSAITSDTVKNADLAYLLGIDRVQNGSHYWIRDSATVCFRAATKITLQPGFRAEEGTYFETVIDSAMLYLR
jgi:hypothetical protein